MDRPRPALSRAAARSAILALPLAFLGLFFLYPLLRILDAGLRPDGGLETDVLGRIFADPGLRGVLWFTLWQAVVSTALTLLLGLPAAYALSRFAFPGRRLLLALSLIPFVLPSVVVAAAFSGSGRSLTALFAAHVFFNLAVVIRMVGGFWSTVDPSFEDAAEELGARGVRRVTAVMLPLAGPAVLGAAALVFLFAFTSFGVVLLLGPPDRATIEVEIFRQTSQLLNLPVAAALALIQMAAVAAMLWGTASAERRAAVRQPLRPSGDTRRAPRTPGERAFLIAIISVVIAIVVAPPARLVARSLSGPDGLTFSRYLDLGSVREGSLLSVSPLQAIANSLLIAASAATIAVLVGLLASVAVATARRGGALRTLTGLPLGVSAVTVGFGYVIAFGSDPLRLRGSIWLVIVAQATVAIPFVLRMVVPALTATEIQLTETAADLGASPWRAFRDTTLPIAAPAIAGAAVFAFVVALGEFGATAFLARADLPTMPVAVYRLLGQPGAASVGQALAMSVLLMVVTASAAGAIDRIRGGSFARL